MNNQLLEAIKLAAQGKTVRHIKQVIKQIKP
jgi:hypothetical protein